MIIQLVKKNIQSEFSKNILTLFTGSLVSQIIPILASIVLARLYNAEDYGVFGLISSIVGISTLVANGNYHKAIVLPTKRIEAINLLALSLIFTVTVSLVLLIICLLFGGSISELLGNNNLGKYICLVPVIVFLTTNIQNFTYWFNRNKHFKIISKQQILQSIINSVVAIMLGVYLAGATGLVVGYVSAMLISVLYLFYNIENKKEIISVIKLSKIKNVAIRYDKFLKYSTVSSFFNSISNVGMPTIIIAIFDPKVAGLYFFASKIVRIPIGLLLTSFAQVYYQKANELFHNNKSELYSFTLRSQKKIAVFLFFCLFVLSGISPWLFNIVFGVKWVQAGELVKYFAILTFFRNIYSSISFISNIIEKQKLLLVFNILLSTLTILSMYVAHLFFDFKISILISSVIGAMCFIVLNIYMLRILKKMI